ncbi:hypothetical protein ADK66_25655 [Micromonospora sp. NRRL B-16802]|nr:hypothetical protein ADK66_25655 [Micromonospora sp. NRRL B-16802]
MAPLAARWVIAVDGMEEVPVLPEWRVHLLSTYDTSTNTVLAQVKVRLDGPAGVAILADAPPTSGP